MRILYIGGEIKNPQNGGERIEYRNQSLLSRVSRNNMFFLNPIDYDVHSLSFHLGMGISKRFVKTVLRTIAEQEIEVLYVSKSIFGRIAKDIKKKSRVKIISFFHNTESDFLYSNYKSSPSWRMYLFFLKAKYWERCANVYSDKIITLNERDSRRLKQLYGRGADYILPTSFSDSYRDLTNIEQNIDYLFLGSAFFANQQGVQWFLDNVMPHIGGNFTIAGKKMDEIHFNNLNDKTSVIGFVDDLSVLYASAKCVVSPIFSGSGMKTKTAEALMYGKTVIGTREAFEGYVIDKDCMIECNTAEEFINVLSKIDQIPFFNEKARKHFLKYYSDDAIFSGFDSFMSKL